MLMSAYKVDGLVDRVIKGPKNAYIILIMVSVFSALLADLVFYIFTINKIEGTPILKLAMVKD